MNSEDSQIRIDVDGRPVDVSARAVALMLSVSYEDLIAELRKNGGEMSKLPEDWKRNARRRAAETTAKLNDDSVMGGLRHFRDNPNA